MNTFAQPLLWTDRGRTEDGESLLLLVLPT